MTIPAKWTRRRALGLGAALAASPFVPAGAAEPALPEIPALAALLAGRTPALSRVKLELPRLADNGFAVPMKLVVDGPFTSASFVRSLHLFSEKNPVPAMASFEFAAPVARVEVESRIRLAGTQSIVAVAQFSDGALHAAVTEVIVTLAACMDES